MLSVKSLVGRQQGPPVATPEPPQPIESRDLDAELATAEADLEAAQQRQAVLYAAAQSAKDLLAHPRAGVAAGKSLNVDGEDAFGSAAFSRVTAEAQFTDLQVEAGVAQLHRATMAVRQIRAEQLGVEVGMHLAGHDDAVNAALRQAGQALEALRAARDERESYVADIRRRADSLYSGTDDAVIRLGPHDPSRLVIAGTQVARRDVGAEALHFLNPLLQDLATPSSARRPR